MEWLTNQLQGWWARLLALGVIGVLAVVFRNLPSAASAAWKLYRSEQNKLHETHEKLADGYQDLTTLTERQLRESRRECETLKAEAAELRIEITRQVRATLVREDINRQDSAMIRALKARMRKKRIDFADIEDAIQKQFENEVHPLH